VRGWGLRFEKNPRCRMAVRGWVSFSGEVVGFR
jgi:hypothetical protein